MVSTGVIIAAVVCCVLVVIGTILGVWGSGVACPDFGMSCPPPSPAGTPGGAPSTAGTPGGTPSTAGTPGGTPSTARTPGGASSPALASLGSTPDAAATAPNVGAPSSTTPTTAASTSKVNCVGYWDACSVSCGTGIQTYRISTPASGGGNACKDTDGTTPRAAGDTKPCSGPVCGVNCVGDWVKTASTDGDGWGPCSATCGSGTQTRTYRITTQQAGGGNSCPKGDGATESRACPNLPACAVAVNCVGAWGAWTGCSAGCGGGTRSKTYYVSTPAANGGTACPKTNGQTESEACNTTPCCDAATAGGWTDVGGVICNGSSSPNPYIYQTRAITFPSNPSGTATATGCNLVVSQYRLTAGPDQMGNKCPDEPPVAGTCSLGNPWSSTVGCAITPSTNPPTAGTCTAGQWFNDTPSSAPGYFDHRYGWSVYNADGSVKYLHRYDGSQYSGNEQGTYIIGSATSKGGFTPAAAVPDALKGAGCYAWVDAKQPGDIPNQRWEQRTINSITCPANYNPSADKKLCEAQPSAITGLTCSRSAYFTANNGTNKCVAK